jgi:hypothetical protein
VFDDWMPGTLPVDALIKRPRRSQPKKMKPTGEAIRAEKPADRSVVVVEVAAK